MGRQGSSLRATSETGSINWAGSGFKIVIGHGIKLCGTRPPTMCTRSDTEFARSEKTTQQAIPILGAVKAAREASCLWALRVTVHLQCAKQPGRGKLEVHYLPGSRLIIQLYPA